MHYLIAMLGGLALGVYTDAARHKIGKIAGDTVAHNRSAGGWAALSLLVVPAIIYQMNRKLLIARAQEQPVEYPHRMRNTVMMACITGFLVFLFSLGNIGGNIAGVKGGVLEFNPTTTVGEALDNYTFFKSCVWESETMENGVEYVNAIGELDVDGMRQNEPLRNTQAEKVEAVFQFVMHRDGSSFNFQAFGLRLTLPDGTIRDVDAGSMANLLSFRKDLTTEDEIRTAGYAGELGSFTVPESDVALERVYANEPLL